MTSSSWSSRRERRSRLRTADLGRADDDAEVLGFDATALSGAGYRVIAGRGRPAPCDAFIENPIAPFALTQQIGALLDA
jgi:hypothetical protein